MKTVRQVSEVLRDRLKEADLTQEKLRDSAGISKQTLSNVLSGDTDYKLSTLMAVADRLGLEVVVMPKQAAVGIAVSNAPVVPSIVDMALAKVVK